jgi:Protein of unknown function (DUF3467)
MSDKPGNLSEQIKHLDSAQAKPNELVNRRDANFRTIYSNNSKFAVSPFDFAMILSQVTESEKGEVYIEQQARVVMSPLHAKIFAFVLSQNVMNFEQRFGEIHIPPDLFGLVETTQTVQTGPPRTPEEPAEQK